MHLPPRLPALALLASLTLAAGACTGPPTITPERPHPPTERPTLDPAATAAPCLEVDPAYRVQIEQALKIAGGGSLGRTAAIHVTEGGKLAWTLIAAELQGPGMHGRPGVWATGVDATQPPGAGPRAELWAAEPLAAEFSSLGYPTTVRFRFGLNAPEVLAAAACLGPTPRETPP